MFRQYVTASHGLKARSASVAETENAALFSSVGHWGRLRQALLDLGKLRKPQNGVEVKFKDMIHPQIDRKFRELIS